MFNIQQMMKKAQEMQKKMGDAQEELKNEVIDAQAGGGVVAVQINGKGELLSLKIKAEAINPENPAAVDTDTIEMLEDLITSAIKEANDKATKLSEEKLKSITGGLNIPGLM